VIRVPGSDPMVESEVEAPSTDGLNLKHLRAELERLDVMIRREVRRWRLAGQDPADAFRGLYVSDEEAEALLARPLGNGWGDNVSLPSDEARAYAEAEAQAVDRINIIQAQALAEGHYLRLVRLVEAFQLDRFELDTLLLCLAPSLDLRYEKLYGYLQDDVTRRRPTVNLILQLLCEPGEERLRAQSRLQQHGALFQHELVRRTSESGPPRSALLGTSFEVDPTVVTWLLGAYQPSEDLEGADRRPLETDKVADSFLAGIDIARLMPAVRDMAVVFFYGPDREAQEAAARLMAGKIGRPLLRLDLARLRHEGPDLERPLKLAVRDARMVEAVPFVMSWDRVLTDGAPMPGALEAISTLPDLAIMAGEAAWQPSSDGSHRPIYAFEFPVPSYPQRVALWSHFMGERGKRDESGEAKGTLDLEGVASQFALTTAGIRQAVASAGDRASLQGQHLQEEHLFAAARDQSNPRLNQLANKLKPRYGWEDIVLPEDQLANLREIVAAVRGRPIVLDEWGAGRRLASSRGATILFAGPPGTGKTMAAEILADELGLDLYKIDLSTVVSKYIGETEKNLDRIFAEAESSNAILFFDEADALFGKRSEVRDSHDRYANLEISYLLQRMESYDGVTILATNLRANLDEAFTRRLQFAVDFPFPEEADRLRIWQTLLLPEMPRAEDLDLHLMARRFELAGGNIRNILLSAAYLAAADGRQLTMTHLLHGARRELQKLGRLINDGYLASAEFSERGTALRGDE